MIDVMIRNDLYLNHFLEFNGSRVMIGEERSDIVKGQ